VFIHTGGEEQLGSLIPLRPHLRCKNGFEISDYLKCAHLFKALLQIKLHGKQHATLDKRSIIYLGLVDVPLIVGGTHIGRGTNGGIKNISHLMGSEDDPQSAKLSSEV
jgi:hypothetical protein